MTFPRGNDLVIAMGMTAALVMLLLTMGWMLVSVLG